MARFFRRRGWVVVRLPSVSATRLPRMTRRACQAGAAASYMNGVPAATAIGNRTFCALGRGHVCRDVFREFIDLLHARPNARRNEQAGTLQCPVGIGGVWSIDSE
jgi:hypothetical protein